ncbi:hypothetical protein M0R45_029941 [Rubus argutus]|uniref:HIRAN domain-containing protein n=1 Tax=Rubus argutus TaxID=59490 RepID=A0AAW1WAB1_RUBAR
MWPRLQGRRRPCDGVEVEEVDGSGVDGVRVFAVELGSPVNLADWADLVRPDRFGAASVKQGAAVGYVAGSSSQSDWVPAVQYDGEKRLRA